MSVPNWLNDGQSFPSNDNGAYNSNGEPSMPFMQTPTASTFDFNGAQNPQLQQQRMPNGDARNGSPAYHNPMYQTQPMIPTKRPRPRENSIGASPQQHPGLLPASRSQTPQAPYPGVQGAVNGAQHFHGSTPYQQFQQGGTHSSQSPVVQNQTFTPQHRVQTMSPSPFSPATQNFSHQVSPPQSENGSRVGTPHNGGPQYAHSVSYGGVPNQPFTPPIGSTVNGAALSQYNQSFQAQQHRINEARVRQMQQQQQRQAGGVMNPMGQPQNQMAPHQMAAIRAQQAQQAQQRPSNPEQLLRTLTNWAQQHGQQFNTQPIISGKPVSSIQLFMGVMKMGGSKKVSFSGQWPHVAAFLQFPEHQQLAAAQELENYWLASLANYEHFFEVQQQQRKALADPLRVANRMQAGDMASRQDAFSPTKQMHSQPMQQLMQPPPQMHTQHQPTTKTISHLQSDSRPPQQNGYMTPQQGQGQGRPPNIYSMPQNSMETPVRATIPVEISRVPASKSIKRSESEPKTNPWPCRVIFKSEFEPKTDPQGYERFARTWGGIQLDPELPVFVGSVGNLLKYKLSVPKLEELGLIDVRALTLSLRSGLHSEVRLALDTFASLSKDYSGLQLDNCDDLIDTLIDCADKQVQLLAEHSAEVSDEMLISPYEDIVRGCKAENATLQDIPECGTLEYNLDRAADRLICITTIIRNFSTSEINQLAVASPVVVRFMASVLRYMGTRSMLLRTHRNLLDFSKDILTILANVSQYIDLPGKEEALCILHFLLAFAPSPPPNSTEEQSVAFSPYLPIIHRYYPYAVDSIAKLLARGDPNRTIYRLIFASDAVSTPPYDLLTRSFGLAIAALPDVGNLNSAALIKARLPYLLQGLLAAEILASLIPNSEHELARSWLASQDGFAVNLSSLIVELGKHPLPPPPLPQRHHQGRIQDPDPLGYATITERGFAILRKLSERAKDADRSASEIPYGVLPNKHSVIDALRMPNLPPIVSRQLCALSSLDN